MEFENPNFGTCELMNCDVTLVAVIACIIATIIFIKNNSMNPYVVTTKLLKDKTWIKGEYFATYQEAKEYYENLYKE